jgi:hypothetical protein
MNAYAAARVVGLAADAGADGDPEAEPRAAARLADRLGLGSTWARRRRGAAVPAPPARPPRARDARAGGGAGARRGDPGRGAGGGLEPRPEGTLLVALHYGPYSTLLWLALARASPGLAVLVDRALDPNLVLPDARARELEAAGALPRDAFAAIEVGGAARRGGVQRLVEHLRAAGTALVLADAYFAAADDPRALRVQLGRRQLALPRGVAWLTRAAGCKVAAASVRPRGDGHRVCVEPQPDVESALARLFALVESAPAPWEGRLRRQPTLDGSTRPASRGQTP